MRKIINLISSNKIFFLIIAFQLVILFSTIGKTKLWDWDECLYAGYAQNMMRSGNLLTNFFNGQVILDKIPLYTIFLQIPLLLSSSEFALRLVNVFFSTALLTAIYFFCKRKFSDVVAISSVLLVLSGEVIVRYLGKISTDVPYALFIFLAYMAYKSKIKVLNKAILIGSFLGLSVLVKGFGVFPFFIVILLSFLFFENNSKLKFVFVSVLSFLVATLPWIIVEYLLYSDKFIQVYFLENIIQRSRYPIEFHFGGRLFYIKLIVQEYFPWILLAFVWPFLLLKKVWRGGYSLMILELRKNRTVIELVLFLIIPLFFLTLAKTKIAWYVAPIYPFLAIYLSLNIELLINKFSIGKIMIVGIMIAIAIDSGTLSIKESRFLEGKIPISPRDQVAIDARKEPEKELDYLVQFSERQAKDILNPTLYTSFTWIYGGNACAYYYSGKSVNYYYSKLEFQKRLKKRDGLFIVQNGDIDVVKGHDIQVVSKNNDFTLFRL